jgi:hypothetical protein
MRGHGQRGRVLPRPRSNLHPDGQPATGCAAPHYDRRPAGQVVHHEMGEVVDLHQPVVMRFGRSGIAGPTITSKSSMKANISMR